MIVSVDTVLSRDRAKAGEKVGVDCIVTINGEVDELHETVIDVQPSESVSIAGGKVSAGKAGTYKVSCRSLEYDTAGEEPAVLIVAPAVSAVIETAIDPAEIAAGGTVSVACTAADEFGNPVSDEHFGFEVSPLDGIGLLTPAAFSAITAGGFFVRCFSVSSMITDDTPAELTVRPGPPSRLLTVLDPGQVPAGTPATVRCLMLDEYRNALDETPAQNFTVEPLDGRTVEGNRIIATKTGTYLVACVWQEGGIEIVPDFLQVIPALPASIDVEVRGGGTVFPLPSTVYLAFDVRDVYGNRIPYPDVELSSLPADGVQLTGASGFTIKATGNFILAAAVRPPTEGDAVLSDSVSIWIDGKGPLITIDYPQRASWIQMAPSADPAITISGKVTDDIAGVSWLKVNGQIVQLGADGAFSAPFATSYGTNVITYDAADNVGNDSRGQRAFIRAERFAPVDFQDPPRSRIAGGVLARLGREAFDDNDAEIDDLARILELVLANMKLKDYIPNPVYAQTYCVVPNPFGGCIFGVHVEINVDDVRFENPQVDLAPRDGGLDLSMTIYNLVIDLSTGGDVGGITGNVTASSANIGESLDVTLAGVEPEVLARDTAVTINDLQINLNIPVLGSLVSLLVDALRGVITGYVENALKDEVEKQVPPAVEGFLASVKLDQAIDLGPPMNAQLAVNAALSSILFDAEGGTLGLGAAVLAEKNISLDPPGSPAHETLANPAWDASRSFGFGLSLDTANQAAYSLWISGAVSQVVSQLGGLDTGFTQLSIEPLLPPVVVKSSALAAQRLALGLGDVKLMIPAGPANPAGFSLTAYLSITAEAEVAVTQENKLSLSIDPQSIKVYAEVESIATREPIPVLGTLTWFIEQMAPILLESTVGNLFVEFPVPDIDLGALSSQAGIPPGTKLGISGAGVRIDESYIVMEGRLAQVGN